MHEVVRFKANMYFLKHLKSNIRSVFDSYHINELNAVRARGAYISEYIDFLAKNKNIFRSRHANKFLLELYKHTYKLLNKNLISMGKNIYILHVVAWGEKYTNRFIDLSIPSLLADDNMPFLSKKNKVIFIIDCDRVAYNIMRNSIGIKKLQEFVEIQYSIIPDEVIKLLHSANNNIIQKILAFVLRRSPGWKYDLFGCLQNIAVHIASQNQACISFINPDMVFSHDFFKSLLNQVKSNKVAVVGTAFRSKFEKLNPLLLTLKKNDKLCLSANEIVTIAAENMHECAKQRIVSNYNSNFSLTPQLIFSYPTAMVIRCLHYHPFLIDFSQVKNKINLDFTPVDNCLLYGLFSTDDPINDQVHIIEDGNFMSVLEISDVNVEGFKFRTFAKDVKKDVYRYLNHPKWNDINKFMFSKRCIYALRGENINILSDINDQDF